MIRLFLFWLRGPSLCMECGKPQFQGYMVNDTVWAEAAPGSESSGVLHLECLEKRLKRRVVIPDFAQYEEFPINRLLYKGYLMGWEDAQADERNK